MKTKTKKRYWISPAPKTCDICSGPIKERFTDGKTQFGPWANMCPNCFGRYGFGLGTGQGQQYTRQADNRWLKTAG
jgi:hypothetical protein